MSTSLLFVIDFDETLTSTDTTSFIASLNTKMTRQWKVFEQKYFKAYKERSELALTRALRSQSMMSYFNDIAEFESCAIKGTARALQYYSP